MVIISLLCAHAPEGTSYHIILRLRAVENVCVDMQVPTLNRNLSILIFSNTCTERYTSHAFVHTHLQTHTYRLVCIHKIDWFGSVRFGCFVIHPSCYQTDLLRTWSRLTSKEEIFISLLSHTPIEGSTVPVLWFTNADNSTTNARAHGINASRSNSSE